jgi:hypothetical protein
VSFVLGPRDLALLDRHLEPVVEPGTFEIQVGSLRGSFEVTAPPFGGVETRAVMLREEES